MQKKREGYAAQPLIRSGQMQQSLDSSIAGGELILGGKEWVKYHQFGTKKMPKRPIYYLRKDDLLDLADFLKSAVERFLRI